MPTTKTIYVDVDVSGGSADGTSLANAYSSLESAISAENADITAAGTDEIHHFLCHNTAGGSDTTNCIIDGYTTDSTHYVIVQGAVGYRPSDELYNTGYHIVASNRYAGALTPTQTYSVIAHIGVSNTNTQSGAKGAVFNQTATALIYACILKGSGYSGFGNNTGHNPKIINCLAYGSPRGFYFNNNSDPKLYNCMARDCTAYGYQRSGTGGVEPIYVNCVAVNNTTTNWAGASYEAQCKYNGSDDADLSGHPGTNGGDETGGVAGLTSGDFEADGITPASGSGVTDAGYDLETSGDWAAMHADWTVPIEDLFGNTRTGGWDMGVISAVAAEATLAAKHPAHRQPLITW